MTRCANGYVLLGVRPNKTPSRKALVTRPNRMRLRKLSGGSQQDPQPKGIGDFLDPKGKPEGSVGPNKTPSRKALVTAGFSPLKSLRVAGPNKTPSRKALVTRCGGF